MLGFDASLATVGFVVGDTSSIGLLSKDHAAIKSSRDLLSEVPAASALSAFLVENDRMVFCRSMISLDKSSCLCALSAVFGPRDSKERIVLLSEICTISSFFDRISASS